MRRDFLKQYIMAIVADGELRGLRSATAIRNKLFEILGKDLVLVTSDLTELAAAIAGNKMQAFVLGGIANTLKDLGSRGARAVWNDLKAQYARGVEANTRQK